MSVFEPDQAPEVKSKQSKLIRAFCRNECCREESTMFLSTTLNILTESLTTNPQGWKTILQLTKALKSPSPKKVKTAVYALTQLWDGKWCVKDGGKWNPGFSSMVGLPDDVYQAHLEALRDMPQFKQWRKYTYELNNYGYDFDEEEVNNPIIQEAYLIASIRDDFEQIIPQHLLPLLREIQPLASSIMSQAVEKISQNDDKVSWLLMKGVCVRNWELVKPCLPQLCRATCNKLLQGSNDVNGRTFWVTLCQTAKNSHDTRVQCCQGAMTEIALTASQLSVCDNEYDDTARILFAGIRCGIWTRGSFARLIETSFKSLSYPWTPALTRFLRVLLNNHKNRKKEACADTPAILSLLKQAMHGITNFPPPNSRETIILLCATHFPSALFCTATNVSWFLSTTRWTSALLALNYILKKPIDGDISLSDVESLVLEVLEKNWGGRLVQKLLDHPDKLTVNNVEGMLKTLSLHPFCPKLEQRLPSTIQLLIQLVSQVGLTTSILQTTLSVAQKRLGSRWESFSLATLKLNGNFPQAKRACRRFKQSFGTSTPPASSSNINAATTSSVECLENLCCQLMNVALTFSQTVFRVTRDTLTETPAALVVEYLDMVCDE